MTLFESLLSQFGVLLATIEKLGLCALSYPYSYELSVVALDIGSGGWRSRVHKSGFKRPPLLPTFIAPERASPAIGSRCLVICHSPRIRAGGEAVAAAAAAAAGPKCPPSSLPLT